MAWESRPTHGTSCIGKSGAIMSGEGSTKTTGTWNAAMSRTPGRVRPLTITPFAPPSFARSSSCSPVRPSMNMQNHGLCAAA